MGTPEWPLWFLPWAWVSPATTALPLGCSHSNGIYPEYFPTRSLIPKSLAPISRWPCTPLSGFHFLPHSWRGVLKLIPPHIPDWSDNLGQVRFPVKTVSSNHHSFYILLSFPSCSLAYTGWCTWQLSQQFQTCELLIWLWLRLVSHLSNNFCIISVSVSTFFSNLKLIVGSFVPKYTRVLSHKKFPQEILCFPVPISSLAQPYSLSHSLLEKVS